MGSHILQGKRVAFVTNNSTKSRKQYLQKFNNLSFEGVREEDIFCTASVAATYLRDILKLEGKVYLLGMEGTQEELQKAGLEFIGHGVGFYQCHVFLNFSLIYVPVYHLVML